MSIVQKIVELNRRYSKRLERKYPRYFDEPSFRDELLRRISLSIEKEGIKKSLKLEE
jgi:hypothetical protein